MALRPQLVNIGLGGVRRRFLALEVGEISVQRRGFRVSEDGQRKHLEGIGAVFVAGYNAALSQSNLEELCLELDVVEANLRGFAYEGAAMAMGILDRITPWSGDRVDRFLSGGGAAYTYVVHIAQGWVAARFLGSITKRMDRLDPLLGWLVIDGYGFHEGFFRWNSYVGTDRYPKRITAYGKRVFDQGLGRSLWFVEGASPHRIETRIDSFAQSRQADLWSGVGVAAVYAGELHEAELRSLRLASGRYACHLAQGAAFAAKARQRAGNITDYTNLACLELCRIPAVNAANVTDEALRGLSCQEDEPAYEIWRRRIQETLSMINRGCPTW